MDKNIFSKLTIIIPTHNRPETLKRHLDYLKEQKTKYDVIIVDSSRIKKNYIGPYRYFYMPGKNANLKILKVLSQIKTKYVLTVADDDLFIPSGVNKCLSFLEKNKNFIGAHGKYFVHTKLININFLNFFKFIPIAYPNYHYDLNKKKSFNRAITYLEGKLTPLNYAVFKTTVFKEVWNLATKLKNEDVLFLEFVPSFLFYFYGNVKCLNAPYITRENSFRKKHQIEFTNSKTFTLAKNYLVKVCLIKKSKNNIRLNRLSNLLDIRKKKESLKLHKKFTFDISKFKIYKLIKVIYFMFAKKYEFEKEKITQILKLYPNVVNEIKKTEMK